MLPHWAKTHPFFSLLCLGKAPTPLCSQAKRQASWTWTTQMASPFHDVKVIIGGAAPRWQLPGHPQHSYGQTRESNSWRHSPQNQCESTMCQFALVWFHAVAARWLVGRGRQGCPALMRPNDNASLSALHVFWSPRPQLWRAPLTHPNGAGGCWSGGLRFQKTRLSNALCLTAGLCKLKDVSYIFDRSDKPLWCHQTYSLLCACDGFPTAWLRGTVTGGIMAFLPLPPLHRLTPVYSATKSIYGWEIYRPSSTRSPS